MKAVGEPAVKTESRVAAKNGTLPAGSLPLGPVALTAERPG